MNKIFVTLLFASTLLTSVCAQEYKVGRNSGRLQITEVNHVMIEGHSGNEIIFSSTNHKAQNDERAKGLRALSSLGLEDNTGLGLSVKEEGDVIHVQQLRKTDGPKVKILVPKGVVISYSHSSPYGNKVDVRNFSGEVLISTVHSGVVLTNTTGKLSVKTVHGDIDASLASTAGGPVSLESVHGHVDVAVPVAVKANLTLGTNWGEVLVDPDLKIQLDGAGDFVNYSAKIKGKLNGGGTEIVLTSDHANVYLRKE